MIIIISNANDAHVPFVTKHLRDGYVVIDVENITAKKPLTYSLKDDGLRIYYDSRELTNVTGVWVRRPQKAGPALKLPIREEHRDYVEDALNAHLRQLYTQFGDATWISDTFNISRAESKVLQLVTARKIGFHVPETVITSDPVEARHFVQSREQTIIKSLSRYAPRLNDTVSLIMWSHLARPTDSINYDGLHLAPSIFQQAIQPAYELRVTVVGSEVFAAKISLQQKEKDGVRDWRVNQQQKGSVLLEAYPLSKGFARKCVALTKKLGLRFGALDFVVDSQGVTWFLEINPNGQWAFVEHETGQHIGKAIAHLLESQHS